MGTYNAFKVTEAEIKMFENMTHSEVLTLSNELKMKYLFAAQVKHKKQGIVATDLMCLLEPFNETKIIFIIGATGIGKTTLAKRHLRVLVERVHSENSSNPSTTPFIFIPAPANGEKSLSWTSFYGNALRQSEEILIEKKQANVVKDGIMTVKARDKLYALRDALDSMLEKREVMVLTVDEAYHMLRFGKDYSAVMDTLKSIVDGKSTKLLLLGSYDLLNLASNYGQVARRSEILHFERYHIGNNDDEIEYRAIINKIQQHWPCETVPPFCAISKELMEATLGCIGLLKDFLLRVLSMQLRKKGTFDPRYFIKAAKPMKLIDTIRKETEEGELRIKGATYGESLFSGSFLKDVIAKMNGESGDAENIRTI